MDSLVAPILALLGALHFVTPCAAQGVGPSEGDGGADVHWEPGSIWESLDDIDGDGVDDLVVVDDWDYSPVTGALLAPEPCVVAVSGLTGKVLWRSAFPSSEGRVQSLLLAKVDAAEGGVGSQVLCVFSFGGSALNVISFDAETGKVGAIRELGVELAQGYSLRRFMRVLPRAAEGGPVFRVLLTESSVVRSPIRLKGGVSEIVSGGDSGVGGSGVKIVDISNGVATVRVERPVPAKRTPLSSATWVDSLEVTSIAYSMLVSGADALSTEILIESPSLGLLDHSDSRIVGGWEFGLGWHPRVLELGDVVGGGASDFAIVVPAEFEGASGLSAVAVVDGDGEAAPNVFFDHVKGGSGLFGCDLANWGDCGFADSIELAGDLNGDGRSELLVGSLQVGMAQGCVVVFDPAAHEVIGIVAAPSGSSLFGMRVRPMRSAREGYSGGFFVGEWWLERPQRLVPSISVVLLPDFAIAYSVP